MIALLHHQPVVAVLACLLLLPVAIAESGCLSRPESLTDAPCISLIVPAFFSPSSAPWTAALKGLPTVSAMIVNPANGPGPDQDSVYQAAITDARSKGMLVIGYIHTGFAQRNISEIHEDILNWFGWYQVDGFFLDQTSSDKDDVYYYQNIVRYVHEQATCKKEIVILNTAQVPDESYVSVGDITVIFEGTWKSYSSFSVPSWVFKYPASKFYHIIYDAPTIDTMNASLKQSLLLNCNNTYVTDAKGLKPFTTLPSYWTQEITTAGFVCP